VPGAVGVGATEVGAGLSSGAVGGSVVTDRQEQAVLAMVRLIKDQDVEVTAQHARSTTAVVTVRIGANWQTRAASTGPSAASG
jgi:hypothetical protein